MIVAHEASARESISIAEKQQQYFDIYSRFNIPFLERKSDFLNLN